MALRNKNKDYTLQELDKMTNTFNSQRKSLSKKKERRSVSRHSRKSSASKGKKAKSNDTSRSVK